jgi:competence protein ComEC
VAGLATAPIAASHFNQVPHYGLLANMLAVPVMGTVIMPAAVLAAVLAPLGLHWIGLAVMRPAIEWILVVAEWVAGMEGRAVLRARAATRW